MPVKHWSFAGLLLTYWCNAHCASCYVCSSPESGGPGQEMSVETGLAMWEGLQRASPHGCRIHIGGGEPFGRWETLIDLARQAKQAGLGPLEAVETNAFWADNEQIVRDRLAALDATGMGRLTISADPYHQQFVPIERPRLAARVAAQVLGDNRVRVRWRDWLADGFDTDKLDPAARRTVFARYLEKRRDRIVARAAEQLADNLELKPAAAFADTPCSEPLLRSRHVHVDGAGRICPGTCAGIILGTADGADAVGRIWQELWREHSRLDIIGPLARAGPIALLDMAEELGYKTRIGYAGKCHLCWDIRRWLCQAGRFKDRLGPESVYRP
jgi:pyruvate-formate lyase-activating enzyme